MTTVVLTMVAAVFLIALSMIAIGFETNIRLLAVRPHSIPFPGVIIYAIMLHYVWAGALLIEPKAGQTTTLADLSRIFGPALPWLLISVATLTLGYLCFFRAARLWPVLCVMPQQAVMTFSALTAISAMIAGTFADGVPRPHLFIVADQAPAVIAAALHTLAVLLVFARRPAATP